MPDTEREGVSKSAPTEHATGGKSGKADHGALVGRTVDRYRIDRILGEGGFGAVYLAEHTLMKRKTAFKTLHKELVTDPGVLRRFLREGQVAARFKHENAIELYDFGQMPDGTYFMAMEFLSGQSLRDVLKKRGALPLNETFDIVLQVLMAMQAAHKGGVVHRDLKPDNVHLEQLKNREDFVKVLDFGIAKLLETQDGERKEDQSLIGEAEELAKKVGAHGDYGERGEEAFLTQAGAFFGTPEYGSPEQCAGEQVDQRSDLYSVGVILYECITGTLPFVSKTPQGYLAQHMVSPPRAMREVNPELKEKTRLPDAVEAAVMKALEKKREDRYQNAEEMMLALQEAADASGIPVTVTGAAMIQASKAPLIIAATVVFLALLATVIWFFTRTTPFDVLLADVDNADVTPGPIEDLQRMQGDFPQDRGYSEFDQRWDAALALVDADDEAARSTISRAIGWAPPLDSEAPEDQRRYNAAIDLLEDLRTHHPDHEVYTERTDEETGGQVVDVATCTVIRDATQAKNDIIERRAAYAQTIADGLVRRAQPDIQLGTLQGAIDAAHTLKSFREQWYPGTDALDRVNNALAAELIQAAERAFQDRNWEDVIIALERQMPAQGFDGARGQVEAAARRYRAQMEEIDGTHPEYREARRLYLLAMDRKTELETQSTRDGTLVPFDTIALAFWAATRPFAGNNLPMLDTWHGGESQRQVQAAVRALNDEANERWRRISEAVETILRGGGNTELTPAKVAEALEILANRSPRDGFPRDRYDAATPQIQAFRARCRALDLLEARESSLVEEARGVAHEAARIAWEVMRPEGRVFEAIALLQPWETLGRGSDIEALTKVIRDQVGGQPDERQPTPVIDVYTDGERHSVSVLTTLREMSALYTYHSQQASEGDAAYRAAVDDAYMVQVEAGPFWMGNPTYAATYLHRETTPVYRIDRREVTVGDFLNYKRWAQRTPGDRRYIPGWLEATPQTGAQLSLPMRNVTYDQALAFARFFGKDLPTEAEWEKAAIGDPELAEAGRETYERRMRLFPWEGMFDRDYARFNESSPRPVQEASIRGASPWGCLDMAGNVAEWTNDYYNNYPQCPDEYRGLPNFGTGYRVVRGGSFVDDAPYMLQGSYRQSVLVGDTQEEWLGFRCVLRARAEQ